MLFLLVALAILVVIVFTSLKIESLKGKVLIFLGLFAVSMTYLWTDSEETREVARHVFLVDYPQFIMVPLVAIAIAGLDLFKIEVPKTTKIGWLLFLIFPLAGNFGTTWAVVPLLLSIYHVLKSRNEERWLLILITVAIFSMNMLALATTAADPPQSYLAVKFGQMGQTLNYFFPITKFWLYMSFTAVLYYIALKRLGVEFGNIWLELTTIRPQSWLKILYGSVLALCVSIAITFLREFQITIFLGSVFLIALISSLFFSKEARDHTIHWSIETAAIFLAFFSVVSFAHLGLHHTNIPPDQLYWAVIAMTLGADNAAAFAAAYPVYEKLGMTMQLWFNLFPSVVYGGLSPLGNGPQIVTFLVILVAAKVVTSAQVFKGWLIEAWVFAPYLLLWQVGTTIWINYTGLEPPFGLQLLIGIVGIVVCMEMMDITKRFNRTVNA